MGEHASRVKIVRIRGWTRQCDLQNFSLGEVSTKVLQWNPAGSRNAELAERTRVAECSPTISVILCQTVWSHIYLMCIEYTTSVRLHITGNQWTCYIIRILSSNYSCHVPNEYAGIHPLWFCYVFAHGLTLMESTLGHKTSILRFRKWRINSDYKMRDIMNVMYF